MLITCKELFLLCYDNSCYGKKCLAPHSNSLLQFRQRSSSLFQIGSNSGVTNVGEHIHIYRIFGEHRRCLFGQRDAEFSVLICDNNIWCAID